MHEWDNISWYFIAKWHSLMVSRSYQTVFSHQPCYLKFREIKHARECFDIQSLYVDHLLKSGMR